jgi:hypothetical protein
MCVREREREKEKEREREGKKTKTVIPTFLTFFITLPSRRNSDEKQVSSSRQNFSMKNVAQFAYY